ncbi:MAG: hypothetical protein IPK58_12155 [Acidobacteria bacterium]|nr:hypothetical protein [Acidobacteriota bacterium]
MAFIDLDSDDPVGNASFYNVNSAVGYGCKNLVEDVKVVQFFLKRIYSLDDMREHKPWGEMSVDGKVGPITRAWIIKTQTLSKSVLVDGVVDKAGNENNASNWESSISHTRYVIRMMNNHLRKRDTALYKTLSTNPDVPSDVRVIFQQIQAAGPPMNYGSS